MEGRTKIFRDRVVSLDQTQELGERHIELLTSVTQEALPGFVLKEHGLEHEPDLYVLSLENAATGATVRVAFTRMVLADEKRVPAIAENRHVPIRARMVELIRARGPRPEILVGVRDLLTDEEQVEADALEAEWRKKNDALLAARRAEEERRERERIRRKQEDEARRRAQRERQERDRRAQTTPGAAPAAGRPGRSGRRRRGRGGAPAAPVPPAGPRPQAAAPAPGPPPREGWAPPAVQPSGGGGGGRRRRRRGRRGGGGGGPAPPQAPPTSL